MAAIFPSAAQSLSPKEHSLKNEPHRPAAEPKGLREKEAGLGPVARRRRRQHLLCPLRKGCRVCVAYLPPHALAPEAANERLQLEVRLVPENDRVLVRRRGHALADVPKSEHPRTHCEHQARHGGDGCEEDGEAAGDDPSAKAERDGEAEHAWPRYQVAADGGRIHFSTLATAEDRACGLAKKTLRFSPDKKECAPRADSLIELLRGTEDSSSSFEANSSNSHPSRAVYV